MPNTWEDKALFNHIKISTITGKPLDTVAGLCVPQHDYISLAYSGGNITGVVYKNGGAGGTTVATLALTYDGSSNLLTVTKS